MGLIDYANAYESRELVQSLTANELFEVVSYPLDETDLATQTTCR